QAAEGDELIPLTPMRRAISEHMVRSRHTSPHAWCSTEVDMTGGVEARAAARGRFREREGIDLSYVPFVIKASCEALKEHPHVNNPGTSGTRSSAPTTNQPQAAIMAMDAIVKRPVVLPGDSIGIRSMMFLSLSFDHRVMDGLQAARFLMSVRHWLEAVTAETP